MSFTLEVEYVTSGWWNAANAPDAVGVMVRGDNQSTKQYSWLYPFLQLYETLFYRVERTNIQYTVVEVGQGIHIVHNQSLGGKVAYQTTYDAALAEVSEFLTDVFNRLDTANGSDERESVEQWLNSWLRNMTVAEIYTDISGR